MEVKGIKIYRSAKGRIKQIVIDANAKTELVEDLIDIVVYETQKDEPTSSWEDVKLKASKVYWGKK